MLHFHKTYEFICIFLLGRGVYHVFPCFRSYWSMFWQEYDRHKLHKKHLLTLSLFVSAMKCLTWSHIDKDKYTTLFYDLHNMIKLKLMLICDTDFMTSREWSMPVVSSHSRVLKNGDPYYLVLHSTSITKFYLTV